MSGNRNVGEVLDALAERAAMLRYLAHGASQSVEPPDQEVMAGVAEVCEDIERMARSLRHSVDARCRERAVKWPSS